MDGIFEVILIATLAIIAVSSVALVVRRNAARARWAADFWLSARNRSGGTSF